MMTDRAGQKVPNRITSGSDAILDGLTEVALADENVLFFAEGVDDPSAVFGTLKGLRDRIDPARLIEMPIAENALTGIAIGASLVGKRPVLSFHRVEFALLAMEQIVNNAAKTRYLSLGRHSVPIVIRLVMGRGWGQGPEHSQSLESMFALVPGLKVLLPSFPADTKGMLVSAIRDNNPVIIIEHRWCHYATEHVPEGIYQSDITGPAIVREGQDVTLVSSSYNTLEAIRAADYLAGHGILLEVIDLRVVRPLNMDLICESVGKTGRLVTVDLGSVRFGVGAEIIASILSIEPDALKASPQRLGMPDHPTPSSRGYLSGLYPDSVLMAKAALETMDYRSAEIELILQDLVRERSKLNLDVPDPFFKGPF